jgi:diguanylate cyclase
MTTMPVQSPTRRVAVATMGLLGAALVAETVLLGSGLARHSLQTPSTVIYNGTILGAALLCALRAAARRVDRAAWRLMAIALGFWAVGELYWDVFLGPSNNAPIPSPADAFWLAFYVPAVASLALLARARLRHVPAALWLDGLIGALGVASVSAALIFDTVLRHTHGRFGVVATGLAYPVGDLVLLSLLVSFAVASGQALRSRA